MNSKDHLIHLLTQELMYPQPLPSSPIELRNHLLGVLNSANSTALTERSHTLTVLVARLRDASTLESETSHGLELLNRYFTAMIDIVDSHGGVIENVSAHSLMSLYGMDGKNEYKNAHRACLSAILIQKAVQNVNYFNIEMGLAPLYAGIGIDLGEVKFAELGSQFHSEHTAMGQSINHALQLESHCMRGQILLSQSCRDVLGDAVEVGEKLSINSGGETETVYELLALVKPYSIKAPRSEARRNPRVKVGLPLNFDCIAAGQRLTQHFGGTVTDLSCSGMRVRTDICLPPLTEICFGLSIGLSDQGEQDIQAKVLRSERCNNQYFSSFEFTHLNTHTKDVLREYIDFRV